MTTLAVNKAELGATLALPDPPAPAPGQARFRVERFALTANNVTYAVHGEDFGYWHFFPSGQEGLGIVPVWGFGAVEASAAEAVTEGQRFFGYWPMASAALMEPVAASRAGFTDGAAHRAALPPFYNRYNVATADWGSEALQCLFRPLYATSFLIDALLSASPVDTLVLSSSSSKTALGVAQAARGRQQIVGLTSPGNRAFCEATGYYDAVLSYAEVAAVPGTRIAFIDFAGNGAVRLAVHTALGDRLAESHVVGDTHWQADNIAQLPGPVPALFFAPTVAQGRVAEWGAAGFDARLAAAWKRFAGTLGWLRIEEVNGRHAVADAWADLVRGRIDPAVGLIASL
ncbi:DUF2855 family protein [Sandarakinorhabdus rubra]|uniref:DUF2855 family protein n=1 Tax=Sandarakinorhabdus rubra TaxID=2672568 RepID=UPI0013D9E0E3|nr:DUF2855 family protein [Sandarakinorhabdus rubra]